MTRASWSGRRCQAHRGCARRKSSRAQARPRPVRPDLEQFIAGLERLPDPRAGVAERLGAVGDAALRGIGARRPVERDKGSPGEIVELAKRIDPGRRHVLDREGSDQRSHLLGYHRAE